MSEEANIVWKLPKSQKGRYVAASRKAGKTLIQWLADLADKASDPIEQPESKPQKDHDRG